MNLTSERARFLRAAVKTGLRLQARSSGDPSVPSSGDSIATLQRIRSSLRRRKAKLTKTQ